MWMGKGRGGELPEKKKNKKVEEKEAAARVRDGGMAGGDGGGIFEIITLSGSFTPTEVGANRVGRMGGLNVCLSSPDGRVIGGTLAGLLVAGGPVQVVAASFLPSGYQEQKKPKKQKTNPNPTPNAPTSAAVFPPNVDNDRYSTPEQNNSAAPKPNLSSSSIHTTNWASMEATPDFRKSATDINISWQGE
ncbi:hypothetical protein TEA_012162 [Camellia sinensis var. sinensis]|uniref:AT-hook motif nuclear-localized protein n=1 Tax=Camellia sinensis var. sinensis TaxID=542762 RepID=A0A4S4DPE2_CAMSN|nr:hypothetical protein TEA_012162 [Camellia sinensis var. sinensis]